MHFYSCSYVSVAMKQPQRRMSYIIELLGVFVIMQK